MAAVLAPQYKTVAYDATSTEGVAVITLDRPEVANAQDLRMTYDLNECFDEACADPGVRCIVLRANGKHFSSGHDLAGDGLVVGQGARPVTPHGFKYSGGARGSFKTNSKGVEQMYTREREIYK